MTSPVQPQTPISSHIISFSYDPEKIKFWTKIIFGLSIITIIFAFSFIAFSRTAYPQKTVEKTAIQEELPVTISGNIDINGYVPNDAVIEIQQRQIGDSAFNIASSLTAAADGTGWSWTTAHNSTTYELKAVVKSQGQKIAESIVLAVTAPADSETLRIVSTIPTPPTPSAKDSTISSAAHQINYSSLSGKVDLNGYIPPNATISINAKKQGETNFSPVTSISAADGISWNWNSAESSVIYELQAVLLSGNTNIGISPTLTTAAPAQNEILVINSKAYAPAAQTSISGIFNINGTVPNGASIMLSIRKSGTPQFNPAQSAITPIDGSSWNISKLQTGVSYDILAYLQVNSISYTQSQLLVITAPAQNEALTFNIVPKPTAPPSSSITFNCPGKNNNSQWQVNMLYNQNNINPSAKAFILQLSTNSDGSDIFSIQSAPNNPSEKQSYTSNFLLNEGQNYFAQYAYSTCQTCTDQSFYSQFTTPIQVRCVTPATNTPTVTSTSTPIPTLSPISTSTPTMTLSPTYTPTPTPKLSQCNESCGGTSGFSCVEGLACFNANPGSIGGDVCRNINCTDKTDCTCQ